MVESLKRVPSRVLRRVVGHVAAVLLAFDAHSRNAIRVRTNPRFSALDEAGGAGHGCLSSASPPVGACRVPGRPWEGLLLLEELARARDVEPEHYDRLVSYACMPNGIWKRTRRERMGVLDGCLLEIRRHRFRPSGPLLMNDVAASTGGTSVEFFRVLRAVFTPDFEQKGYADLIAACGELARRGIAFRCEILGDGPLRAALEAQIAKAGLGTRVALPGSVIGDRLLEHFERADLFALLCVEASDGDRDGIPNTLIEAMAMELPVVSTSYSGVPELVVDGTTGLLVDAGDVAAGADALAALLRDPARRERMAQAGRERVTSEFTSARSTQKLEALFKGAVQHA